MHLSSGNNDKREVHDVVEFKGEPLIDLQYIIKIDSFLKWIFSRFLNTCVSNYPLQLISLLYLF